MSKPRTDTRADPHREREAEKYERPIPSRELILEVLADSDGPMTFEPLAGAIGLSDPVDLEALRRRLNAMERDGQVVRNRRSAYLPVAQTDLISGRLIGHPDGFGFLVPDEGGDDVFMSARQMRSLLHGDRAVVRIVGLDRRGRPEGALVEVLERANHQVVGRFYYEGGIGFVIPDNKRINQDLLIPPEHTGGAVEGDIVVAAILQQPTKRNQPIGRIVEVLGQHMAPGMEIDVAIRAHELPHVWPAEVEQAARAFGEQVPEAAKRGRIDLRDIPLVTIDGEDARDFDDAVFCERQGRGWRLLVAIADVSHYVEPDSAIDREATLRGNSVYFPGRVIPMLPEVLSNGLCSLNPQVDRLCMVCEMQISARGDIKKYSFYEAVMRSAARLTYTSVAAMIVDRDARLRRQHEHLVHHLDDLHALYRVLHEARDRRGAIDFDTTETRIVFGRERKIERIVPVIRNDAHRLIEECMIAANVCAARFLSEHEIPGLHRVHDGPKADKLEDLRQFLGELGLELGGGDTPCPKDYSKLLGQVAFRPDAHLIQTVLLRSMSQAVYSPDPIGHFGLAHEDYAHFTSPIRRYPDLLVHRAIRHVLRKGSARGFRYEQADMLSLGQQCSMTERRADEATQNAVDWLKCEYMLDKVGDDFPGIISAVTSFGLFIELAEIYVEGLVHVTNLDNDYYRFDAAGHRLYGERAGRVFSLGDPVRVRVARVDLDDRKIDFALLEHTPARHRGREPATGEAKAERRGRGKTRKPQRGRTGRGKSPRGSRRR
ncbi:MAG: ribonuclease R [Chromatiales bacterium]|jgi:ribonuclease R